MTRILNRVCTVAASIAVVVGWASLRAQDAPANPCALRTTDRIVAVADVHGAYDELVAILQTAGLIDARLRWTGGRTVFVQTGDVLDRGAESRRAVDLLRRLERDAARAGGQVHALLGNHEVMRMMGDMRYVSDGEYAAFRSGQSAELRDRFYQIASENARSAAKETATFEEPSFRSQFLAATPLGSVEMQLAFAARGDYGTWLRRRNAMVAINNVAFVHGGISPAIASLGCAGINAAVRSELSNPLPATDPALRLITRDDGPLWYRGLALEPEDDFSDSVGAILSALGVDRIVIGHTVTADRKVTPRFDGRVIQLDTGMLGDAFFPGGRASALEIRGGELKAIYKTGSEPIAQGKSETPLPAYPILR